MIVVPPTIRLTSHYRTTFGYRNGTPPQRLFVRSFVYLADEEKRQVE